MSMQQISDTPSVFKTCVDCKFELPLSEFYKHAQMADGHLNKCKTCVRSRVKTHRRENDHVREYDLRRCKAPERKAKLRTVVINWRKENPDKYHAETAVGNAIRDGKLAKKPCEDCGEPKVHAHHDDYSRPLDVRWLCAKHHHRHHAACIQRKKERLTR